LLEQSRANAKRSGRRFPKRGTAQYRQMREQVVQYLVRRAQLAAEAEERDIEISDDEIEQRRKLVMTQYFGGDEKLYRKRLERNGLTEEQARADIEASLIQEELFKDVGKNVKVSDAEMRKYFRRNKGKYGRAYGQVKEIVREELLQKKRNEASSKNLLRLARKGNVTYQVGFGPRA
jgi:peptidyl-prolyl cis-trans isomerase SurA